MKKILSILLLAIFLATALNAQDNKDKVKKTTTLPQKVHNTVSRHKKSSGYKAKQEHNGLKKKQKVDYKTGSKTSKVKKS